MAMNDEQPAPTKNDQPACWPALIEQIGAAYSTSGLVDPIAVLMLNDMRDRHRVGIERYKTALQPFNGRDALVDAYQEGMDLSVYLKQLSMEQPDDAEIKKLLTASIAVTFWIRTKLLTRDGR